MNSSAISAFLLVSAVLVGSAAAADQRVESAVERELQRSGAARVTILFDTGESAKASRAARQQRIALLANEIVSAAGDGFELHRRFGVVSAVVGTLDRSALNKVLALPYVRSVGPDPGGSGHLDVARELMGVDVIQQAPPPGLGITGGNVKTVVMDSGIDSDNMDFSGALVDEACFCTAGGAGCCPNGATTQLGSGAAEDDHGHGTWVSGHVLSQGNDGPKGAAPDASLVAVKVLDSNNSFCCASDVTAAYDWVATNHPDAAVLNASLGTNARFATECSAATTWLVAMSQAIGAVEANGTLMTASSGNDQDSNGIGAPSCIGDVMAVGATYKQNYDGTYPCNTPQADLSVDDVTCFSNVSPELEVLAPGAFMDTTALGGGTATGLAGTSFSAPLVAGCAALMKSASPTLTADEIRTLLIETGVPILDERVDESYPRVDCLSAVLAVDLLFSNGFESD